MKPANQSALRQITVVVLLVLVCLVFRRVFYAFELAALQLRYFWWLFVILALGWWLASLAGRTDK